MRLRNIPGAQDAILESSYVVQEPQTKKGPGGEVFVKKAGSIPGYFMIKCKNYPLFYESFTLPPGRPGGFFREICPWRCPYAF
mgnify:CR=1 FL=1